MAEHGVQQQAQHHHNARLLAVTGPDDGGANLGEGRPVMLRQEGLPVAAQQDKERALEPVLWIVEP